MIINLNLNKLFKQGGSKYFTDRNPEDSEIQESLNSKIKLFRTFSKKFT